MKRNEILDEHKKGVRAVIYNKKPKAHSEPPKPRNPVAKNAGAAIGGGAAGAHKDAKKASQAVRGQKHKNAEMAEYGDTAKGQKMLTKVQKRAVDRVVSKKADTDPAYAKKNSDTANRAWERMTDKDVAEGLGNFAKAIDNLHGWYQVKSRNPDVEVYEFDDREGGFYADGTVYHNVKTGRVKIEFEDKIGEYGGMNVNDTFNSIGDAMNVLRQITIPIRPNNGKAQNFDRLGGRELAGPNDVYKTDRTGKKGTLTKSRMDTMKMSSPYRKTGPKGVLPEQGVAEMDSQGYTGSRDDYKLGGPEGTGKAMKAKEFAKKALDILNKQDDDGEEWYDRHGNPSPNGAYDAGGKNAEIAEGGRYGSRNPDLMNPNDYDRYQQDQMDFDKRAFKRAELQHELGHEDDPDFERKFRQQQIDRDRGPWYLKVNGKILKVKGEPKVFDWKKGANNYALAVLKNKPELQGKIFLTKKNEDDVAETTTGKVTASGPQGVEITNPASGVKTTLPAKMASALAPKDGAPNQYTLNPQAVSGGTSSENKPEGPKVGSEVTIPDETNEQNLTPSDSTSPIHGGHDDQEHDQIISLLKKLLHKGVDEMDNSPVSVQTGIKSDLGHMKKMAGL